MYITRIMDVDNSILRESQGVFDGVGGEDETPLTIPQFLDECNLLESSMACDFIEFQTASVELMNEAAIDKANVKDMKPVKDGLIKKVGDRLHKLYQTIARAISNIVTKLQEKIALGDKTFKSTMLKIKSIDLKGKTVDMYANASNFLKTNIGDKISGLFSKFSALIKSKKDVSEADIQKLVEDDQKATFGQKVSSVKDMLGNKVKVAAEKIDFKKMMNIPEILKKAGKSLKAVPKNIKALGDNVIKNVKAGVDKAEAASEHSKILGAMFTFSKIIVTYINMQIAGCIALMHMSTSAVKSLVGTAKEKFSKKDEGPSYEGISI